MKTAILIPCYNEEQTIAKVVKDFKASMPQATIYVYDNNSTDHTAMVAAEAGAVVCFERRQGKGNVIRQMLRDIEADCYLVVDGDDTYPAELAPRMCELVEKGADMVVGDRLSSTYFQENKRPFHNFGNILVRWMVNKIFKAHIHDIMTGYRALGYNFAKNFPVVSNGFEIETEMTIHALDKNFIVEEIPVSYRDRNQGSVSKLHTFTDGIKVIGIIFQLFRNYKPFVFFGLISLLLFFIATVFFVPVFAEYLETGLVPRFPTLIACGFIYSAGLLSFFCGVILEVVAQKHRQLYEFIVNHYTHSNIAKR